jgi:hypothetical protein
MKTMIHLLRCSAFALLFGSAPLHAAPATVIVPDKTPVNAGIQSYTVTCAYQKKANELEVLTPTDYTPTKHYPVVYLLPVNAGTSGQWGSGIVEAQKSHLQDRYEMIFVAPAYDTLPWFGDNVVDPGIRQNSYITDVVVPFIDKTFSTIPEARGRGLVGFSKSGLGAWALFLQRPEMFGQVALFDSYEGQPSDAQWHTWGFADTYGTRANFDAYEPLGLLAKAKDRLATAGHRITLLAGGPGSRVGVDTYRSKLEDLKIPYVYIYCGGMAHAWTTGWLPLAVAALVNSMDEK